MRSVGGRFGLCESCEFHPGFLDDSTWTDGERTNGFKEGLRTAVLRDKEQKLRLRSVTAAVGTAAW